MLVLLHPTRNHWDTSISQYLVREPDETSDTTRILQGARPCLLGFLSAGLPTSAIAPPASSPRIHHGQQIIISPRSRLQNCGGKWTNAGSPTFSRKKLGTSGNLRILRLRKCNWVSLTCWQLLYIQLTHTNLSRKTNASRLQYSFDSAWEGYQTSHASFFP